MLDTLEKTGGGALFGQVGPGHMVVICSILNRSTIFSLLLACFGRFGVGVIVILGLPIHGEIVVVVVIVVVIGIGIGIGTSLYLDGGAVWVFSVVAWPSLQRLGRRGYGCRRRSCK